MLTRKSLLSLLAVVPFLAAGSALPSQNWNLDGNQIPVVVLPSSSTVEAGDPITLTIAISGVTTQNQVVYLSSDSSLLPLPTSVTVPAGQSSVAYPAHINPVEGRPSALDSTYVTVTATCNNGSAYGHLTITY